MFHIPGKQPGKRIGVMFFNEEKIFIEGIRGKIGRKEYENNPLTQDLHDVLSGYEKTLNETERLIQISDLLQKNLNNTNRKLQAANEMRSQLIDLAIHDLKNPLTLIICYLDILQKNSSLDSAWQEIVRTILKSAQGMNELISDMLSTERIGEKTILLRLASVDLIEILNTVITNNQMRLELKKQKLDFRYDKSMEFMIKADKLLLTEICDNLISNAIKYSPFEAEIYITAGKKNNENQDEVILISFNDQGPGFSETDKKRMFRKFQKLSADPTGDETSTGLGLYITKKLVELHNGRIWLESTSGTGSTFFVELKTH